MTKLFKHVILDAPFDEDVQPVKVEKKKKEILSEGETVIWKGSPNHSRSVFDKNYTPQFFMPRLLKYYDFLIYGFAVISSILIAGENFTPVLIMASIVFPLIIISHYFVYLKRKRTQFILTTEKLVFINWRYGFKRLDFIPIKNIKNVISAEDHNYENLGHIHFTFKNEETLPAKTRDFMGGSILFTSPFFKNVKNVKQVYKLIEKQKAKNKKK